MTGSEDHLLASSAQPTAASKDIRR